MKVKVIESLKTNTPLSPLHEELDKRRTMKYKDLFDWRMQHYPSIYDLNTDIGNLNASEEISDILREWYLESNNIKIPEYLFTDEDHEISSRWSIESIDYATKVLLPVIQQLLILPNETEMKDLKSLSLESRCVSWGGNYKEITFVNTCPLDNFITVLSLHLNALLNSIKLSSTSFSLDIQSIIRLVEAQNFDELRYWIAPKMNVPLTGCKYDFFGYEGKLTELLRDIGLYSNLYEITFQCWGCCCISEKRLDLSSVYNFKDSCQKTIEEQINSGFKCLKCRDPEANIEQISSEFLKYLRF